MATEQAQTPVVAASRPGCLSQLTTALVALLALSALTILALTLVGIDPWSIAAPQPAPTVRTLPTAQPLVTRAPAQQQQVQATAQPAVQTDPAVPAEAAPAAPAVQEYIPPEQPIVQPTADPTYAHTVSDYSDRSACSMPRADPATCAQLDAGEVPPIVWPNGREP